MKLLPSDSPILRAPCEPFDFENPPFDAVRYSEALVKLMRDSNGIGLSANQVTNWPGPDDVQKRYRIFALRTDPNTVCFNPRITATEPEEVVLEEGCLSFPGLIVKVKRHKTIRVRFQTPNGEFQNKFFTGMSARAFQHELDHLDGKLFFNRANKFHRDQALRQYDRNKRKRARFEQRVRLVPTKTAPVSQQKPAETPSEHFLVNT